MSTALILEAAARFPFRVAGDYDYKAWAKRILYRDERGDKDLLPIKIKFAKMAMNVQDEAQS